MMTYHSRNKNECTMTTRELLKTLIWPAVAGNVAWGFFTVLIDDGIRFPDSFGRLSALLLLSVYLIITYMKSQEGKGEFIDIIHSVTIILCAIAIQAESPLMDGCLIVLFIVAALGHWTGRWIPESVTTKRGCRMALVGSIHILGAWVCYLLPKFVEDNYHLNLSVSISVVLVLWILFRDWIYLKWK